MFVVMISLVVSFLLIAILKIVSSLISERVILNREELSPYECGFEHHNVSRIPLSLRYFMLTLLFLLFDLEIVFLLFLPHFYLFSFNYFSLFVAFLFVAFLFISLIYEWVDGTLEWVV